MSDGNCSNSTISAGEWMHYVCKIIMLPCYLVIGSSFNIILLIVFYKQAKKEGTYNYQVLLTVSKTLEVVVFGTYLLGQDWFSGLHHKGAEWFQKSYVLMFITYKIGAVLHIHFIITSALLATAMAADRVFALGLPLRYKNINHTRHQVVAAATCFSLPIAKSIFSVWMRKLSYDGDKYTVGFSDDFWSSFLAPLVLTMELALRITCVIALIPLNVVMVALFHKRTKNLAKLTNQQEIIEAQKSADRTLLILNVSQSILMCINQIPHVSQFLLFVVAPRFMSCYGTVILPVADAMIFLSDSIDLVVVMCINKKMRGMVFNVIGWKCCGAYQNAPGGQHAPNQAWTN